MGFRFQGQQFLIDFLVAENFTGFLKIKDSKVTFTASVICSSMYRIAVMNEVFICPQDIKMNMYRANMTAFQQHRIAFLV